MLLRRVFRRFWYFWFRIRNWRYVLFFQWFRNISFTMGVVHSLCLVWGTSIGLTVWEVTTDIYLINSLVSLQTLISHLVGSVLVILSCLYVHNGQNAVFSYLNFELITSKKITTSHSHAHAYIHAQTHINGHVSSPDQKMEPPTTTKSYVTMMDLFVTVKFSYHAFPWKPLLR